jgi:hypothetical protein
MDSYIIATLILAFITLVVLIFLCKPKNRNSKIRGGITLIEYLKNDICKFTPLNFTPDYDNKKDVICVSLFKMRKGYRDFQEYVVGIKRLEQYTIPGSVVIRLFVDDTIIEDTGLMDQLKTISNIEIVRYEMPRFKKDKYHLGTIGTMARFFPMFDLENNDARIVLISDADMDQNADGSNLAHYHLLKAKIGEKIEKLHTYIFSWLKMRIIKDEHLYYHDGEKITPYLLGSHIISFKRYPSNIVLDFMTNVANMSPEERKEITLYYLKEDGWQERTDEGITYGIDEYMLNKILRPYIFSKPIAVHIEIETMQILYIKDPDNKNIPTELKNKNRIDYTNLICALGYQSHYDIYKKLYPRGIANKDKTEVDTKEQIDILTKFYKIMKEEQNTPDNLRKYSFMERGYVNFLVEDGIYGSRGINMITFYNCDIPRVLIDRKGIKYNDYI